MQSTYITFQKVCEEQGVIEGVHFRTNLSSNVTTFFNGSVIIWKDLEYKPSDPMFTGLGSYELTAVFIDEAGEIVRRCYQILFTRIRHQLINGEQKMLMSCNPSKNFLFYDCFVLFFI